MNPISQITTPKPRILIHHPDRRLCFIQPLGPWHNGRVQLLDLAVVRADSNGDDLRDDDFHFGVGCAHCSD